MQIGLSSVLRERPFCLRHSSFVIRHSSFFILHSSFFIQYENDRSVKSDRSRIIATAAALPWMAGGTVPTAA
jgi:hypothetical protein